MAATDPKEEVDAFCNQEGFGVRFGDIKELAFTDEMHSTKLYVNKRRARPLMDSRGAFIDEEISSFMGGCILDPIKPSPYDPAEDVGPTMAVDEEIKPMPNVFLSVDSGKKEVSVKLTGELHIAKMKINGTEGIVENGKYKKEITYDVDGGEYFGVKFIDEEI